MSNINSALHIQQVNEQPSSKKKPFALKVVLLGDSGVGKTAFVLRLCENKFKPEYASTLGVDIVLKSLNIRNNVEVRVEIVDTAGQERYKAITPAHIRSADGLIVFYGVNKKENFANIHSWIQFIDDTLGEEPYVLMLVGTKVDMNEREVQVEDGQKLAKDLKALFFEVSAKTGENVEEAFATLAEELHGKKVERYKGEVLQLQQLETNNDRKKCCNK